MCAKTVGSDLSIILSQASIGDKHSEFCLVLTGENTSAVETIAQTVAEFHPIRHCHSIGEAQEWLAGGPSVSLLIADADYAKQASALLRKRSSDKHVPILITCHSADVRLSSLLSSGGITDILTFSESSSQIKTKIAYYLDLKQRVQATPPAERTAGFQPFRLPWWKRLLDIAVSLTALIILSPFLLLVAIAIVIDSKGPAFYTSKRAGTNFRVFNMYKYRTMRVDADQQLKRMASSNIYAKAAPVSSATTASEAYSLCSACQTEGVSCRQLLFDQNRLICEKQYLQSANDSAKFMKFRNDPRITRIGTFLRNSSIDELPQLLNVLLGDMSLVGNRPLPLYEAEKLTSDEFAQRFAGPAGLTGLWQVKKRAKGQGPMSDRERTLLDIDYASSFSFKTDAYIIWRTLFSLWQKENV